MKTSKLIIGCLATLGLSAGVAVAQDVDRDAIAERLKPVGALCLEGDECGTAVAQAAGGASGGGSGGGEIDAAGIYNSVCMACHETGAAGAPKRGDEAAWAERTGKGFATLVDHAIHGFNAMPAKGGNPNLSDAEVEASVAYLVEPVMELPALGGDAAPADAADTAEDTASETAAADTAGDDATAEAEAATTEDAAAEPAVAEASAGATEPAHAGIDGEAIYNQACMACHMTGAAGAPILGDAGAWEPRLAQGVDTLYTHAINGIGAMPPKGGNMSLSDDEVKAAVDHLVEAVQ